jgi:hypothetical protein
MKVANQTHSRNSASEISTKALGLLGHMRAALLTERERNDLWDIATGRKGANGVTITMVEKIAARLEGRRGVA